MNAPHETTLPPGWIRTTLAEAVQPSRPRVSPKDHLEKPFIGLEHVEPHSTKIIGQIPTGDVRSGSILFQPGDVLYGRMRPYLNKVCQPDFDGLCSAEFIVLPENEVIRGDFLKYRLNAGDFVSFANHLTDGERPRVDFEEIGEFPLLLPPPTDQARIVEKLAELFGTLDAGLAALARAARNLPRYRAAVLHAAVTGRLTAAWRAGRAADEPAAALLRRLLAERRRRWAAAQLARFAAAGKPAPRDWQARYPEPTPPDTASLPELPAGWCWATVDQVGEVQLGRQRSPQYHNGPYMRPYLRVANVFEDRIDTSDVFSMNFTPAEQATYGLQYGDILLNEGQSIELVGRPAMYRDEVPGACFQNTLVRFRTLPGLDPIFALLVFRAYLHSGRFRRIAKWTTNIAHLGAERFANLEFPLPPVDEQAALVSEVEDRLSLLAAVETAVEAAQQRAGRLRQSILKRAFAGRLVPPDPRAEPAAALLERLRQSRTRAAPKKNRANREPRGNNRPAGPQGLAPPAHEPPRP